MAARLPRQAFAEDPSLRTISSPFTVRGVEKSAPKLPPAIGQHTDEVLGEFGFGTGEIEKLRADGVVA